MRRGLFVLIVALVFGGLGFGVGRMSKPSEVKRRPAPTAHHDDWDQRYLLGLPPVRDALRRWAIKSGEGDGVMKGRYVEVMNFPDRLCVQFTLETGSVGGVPIYCYAVDRSKTVPRPTTRLIYEHSDVE